MAREKDYTGQLVGSKRILGRANELCNKHPKWAWRCEQCGYEGPPATISNLNHGASAGYVGCNNCKTPRLKPIPIGTQVNNLVVIGACKKDGRNPSGSSKRYVPARCLLCGREDWWQKCNFLAGISNCNCHREVQGGLSNTRVGIMWAAARKRASDQGVPFTIAHSDISIPELCPVLGIPLSVNEGGTFHDASPSLDKIIPSLGYVPGNIAVISWRANRLKGDGTTEELQAVASWMAAQEKGARLAA
jgi:hypothetical protein